MTTPNVMDEDWSVLVAMMPRRWRELAQESGAFKGLRKDKNEVHFLRTLLLHLACGYSLRETALRAREAKLADLSDVAVLKRLRKSKDWLHGLCRGLLEEEAALAPPIAPQGLCLRLIDATLIQEPGPTGSAWRIHYSLRWPQLNCDHFELTSDQGKGAGESLTRFPVRRGDHLLADRGYCNYASIEHVRAKAGVVTVRLSPNSVRLLDEKAKPFALQRHLKRLHKANEVGCWPVQISGAAGQTPVPGRLCVVRKSRAATARSQAKAEQTATRKGRQLRADTLFHAGYVMVFTTAAQQSLSAAQVLEIYRLRWQIELVFKRFKQLAQIGHLPKEDAESSKAWLYGKLFVALLGERLMRHAQSLSPWGYGLAPTAQSKPLAGI